METIDERRDRLTNEYIVLANETARLWNAYRDGIFSSVEEEQCYEYDVRSIGQRMDEILAELLEIDPQIDEHIMIDMLNTMSLEQENKK